MLRIIVLAIAAFGLLGPAQAGEPTSTYTKISLKKCKALSQGEQGASWRCKGLPGFPLYVAEGDLRMMIAYGSRYADQRAATQTLSAFNTLAEKKGVTTLEWRLADGAPFATIVRYETQSDASGTMVEGEVLVVAKVGGRDGTDACHVAYVDALANPDANELARQAADELAAGFDCGKDPVIIGKSGKSPM